MTPRDKPFPQRSCAAPPYRAARFERGNEAQIRAERGPEFNLKSKLLRARIAILSHS